MPSVVAASPRCLSASSAVVASLPSPAQIKHFLKEDSDEAELVQFLGDRPAQEESCRHLEQEGTRRDPRLGRAEPEMLASMAGRTFPEDLLEEKEPKAFHRPRPLDFKPQHIAPPAPASPSRPRSPWGRLDPYESDEVGQSSPPRARLSLLRRGGSPFPRIPGSRSHPKP